MRITIRELTIPKVYQNKFAVLKNLKIKQRNILIQELKKRISNIIEFSSKEIEGIVNKAGIKEKELLDIIDLIYQIFYIYYSEEQETSIEDFLKKLEEGIKDTKNDEIIPNEEDWDDYISFWRSILSMDKTIGLLSKAKNIRRDNQNIYIFSKIYTDIRPIFSRQINLDLTDTAIIYHNLKLEYKQGLLPDHFFISLTPEDLKDMKKVIDRALEKEDNIIKVFKLKDLNLIKNRE